MEPVAKMMKKIFKAQIATILIFIMAVLFLFTLITINISRLAQKKTTVSNIADSVGLRLASQLGSMANALKREFEISGEKVESCDVNWKLVLGGLFIVIGAALIWTGWGGVLAVFGVGLALGGIGFGFFGVTQQFMARNQGAQEQMKLKFKNLSALQQIIEAPVYGALSGLVDDPALVKDKFDLDRDGRREDDYIPRFFQWYITRLNSFPATGPEVENFYNTLFGGNRFNIKVDSNKMVMKREKKDDPERPDSEGWWVDWQVDYNGDGQGDLKLVPWLNNQLRAMLAEMRLYGYGVNGAEKDSKIVSIEDTTDKAYEGLLGIWINEIEEFENVVARGLYDMDRDTAVQGLDNWLDYIIYTEKAKDSGCPKDECPPQKEKPTDFTDWYTRLGTLQNYAVELRDKLYNPDPEVNSRKEQIHECIEGCERQQWDCCEEGTRDVPSPTKENPDAMRSETYCVKYDCCGEPLNCGRLCDDEHCKPEQNCSTPLGGSRWCCAVLLLESPSECAASINIVDRYDAISILDKFIADVQEVRNDMQEFYNRIQDINKDSYNKMHEAFYVWSDYVGGVGSEKQEVAHIAYVNFAVPDLECFGLPSIKHRQKVDIECPKGSGLEDAPKWQQWLSIFPLGPCLLLPLTCVCVRNATGEFTLTVARFDEDTAKKGPLSRFWRFRFGRPGVNKEADEKFVRDIADKFKKAFNQNKYIDDDEYKNTAPPGDKFTDADKNKLRDILNSYGIVSKVRVHYGPGETPEEGKTVSAEKKNKDIYIMETSSKMD